MSHSRRYFYWSFALMLMMLAFDAAVPGWEPDWPWLWLGLSIASVYSILAAIEDRA